MSGAFADAMAELRRLGLGEAFREAVQAGKPCLGVCLGLQLLFDSAARKTVSTRGSDYCRAAWSDSRRRPGLKVPHMGWNTLRIRKPAPLLAGLPTDAVSVFRPLVPRGGGTR